MRYTRWVFWLHVALAAGGLAVGLALRGYWSGGLGLALLGVVWVFTQARGRWPALGGVLLFVFAAAAAAGVKAGLPLWLGLLVVIGALGAWDLDFFLRRLAKGGGSGRAVNFEGLVRAHLRHLLLVEAVGASAGVLAISARLRLPFWWVILLAALAFFGLGQLVRYLREQAGGEAPQDGEE